MFSWKTEGSVYKSIRYADYCNIGRNNLLTSTRDSLHFIQRLGLWKRFTIHTGCVNSVYWNDTGELLLSGSDDHYIAIVNPHYGKIILKDATPHKANILSAKFLPGTDDEIISCSRDGLILHRQILLPFNVYSHKSAKFVSAEFSDENYGNFNHFNCHKGGAVYDLITVPTEPKMFFSCGNDCKVRLFDLRETSGCTNTGCRDNVLISNATSVISMDLSPISHFSLALGCTDSKVRIYDRRFLKNIMLGQNRDITNPKKLFSFSSTSECRRVTSVKYSSDEIELLANISPGNLYLVDVKNESANITGFQNLESISSQTLQPGSFGKSTPRLRLMGDWSDTGPNSHPNITSNQHPIHQTTMTSPINEIILRLLVGTNDNFNRNARFNTNTNRINVSQPRNTAVLWRRVIGRILQHSNGNEPIVSSSDQPIRTIRSIQSNDCLRTLPNNDIEHNARYIKMKYYGHRNTHTTIEKAVFMGKNFVMSGSDCGHIFIWHRHTGKIVKIIEADKHVVNCIQPHPQLPYLASSGIDYDVKLWAPNQDQNNFNKEYISELIERNQTIIKHTQDIVAVPASFLLRMVSRLHAHQENPH